MAMTKWLLGLLQLLTVATAINPFTFDKQQRIFRKNAKRQRLTGAFYKKAFWPLLLLTLGGFFIICLLLYYALPNKLPNTNAIGLWSVILFNMLCLKVLLSTLAICVLHTSELRLAELERLLNDFVGAYDQHELLIGRRLRIKWKIFLLLVCKLILSDVVIWFMLFCLFPILSWAYLLLEVQSLILSLLPICGLLILHALFRGAQAAVHDPSWTKPRQWPEMEQLLQFYGNVLRLRSQLELYARFIVSWELILDAVLFTYALCSLQGAYRIGIVCLALILIVYPTCWICLTHEIYHVQQHLGNDLLNFDYGSGSAASDELLEMFCIQKLALFKRSKTFFDIFHWRRSFILMFLHFACLHLTFIYAFY